MHIQRFTFGPFETNCYVVNDEYSVLIIDPACSNDWEQKELLTYINSLNIQHATFNIIATHGHLDHLWGAHWATEQWGTPVLMHEADIPWRGRCSSSTICLGSKRPHNLSRLRLLTLNQTASINFQLSIQRQQIDRTFNFYRPRVIRREACVCIFPKRRFSSPVIRSFAWVSAARICREVTTVS